jgi:putative transposase
MAEFFKVSRSGYYKFINKKESLRSRNNKKLIEKIKIIHKQKREVYGSPRIHMELKKQGESCSRIKVAKLMTENNIKAKTKKKWKATTKGTKDVSKIVPNLLEQNFSAEAENEIWVEDITYVWTKEGWLYVSTILDLYSRKIVGLSMGNRIDTDLVIRSLNQAVCHRGPKPGLILHSDRGVQYTSIDYKTLIIRYGMRPSMSAKGNCYDNAAMESFFHTLKTEHIFFYDFKTRQEAMNSIFEYIEIFYNRQRSHSYLNYLTPEEFEQKKLNINKLEMSSVKSLAAQAL